MTQVQSNFAAMAAGEDGSPAIAVNSFMWSGVASGAFLDVSSGMQTTGVGSFGALDVSSGIRIPSDPSGSPEANTIYKSSVARGWIDFDGTGTISINDSFNVSSITDNGAGDYTITWDRDFADGNYAVVGTVTNVLSATDVRILEINETSAPKDPTGVGSFGALDVSSGIRIPSDPSGSPEANTIYKSSVARGWIDFDGTGTISINDSFNVSSITDNGAGDYTITWDRDFADGNYAVVGTVTNVLSATDVRILEINETSAPTAGAMGIFCVRVSSTSDRNFIDESKILVIAFGGQ